MTLGGKRGIGGSLLIINTLTSNYNTYYEGEKRMNESPEKGRKREGIFSLHPFWQKKEGEGGRDQEKGNRDAYPKELSLRRGEGVEVGLRIPRF